MAKLLRIGALFIMCGCTSITIEKHQPSPETTQALAPAPGSYSAGSVSGQTRVQSDQLLKSSLPCRLLTFKMPSQQPVTTYIQSALQTELLAAEKISAPEGRRIDIVVVQLESDTSKGQNVNWSLDFVYKIGRISREIQTSTDYPIDSNDTVACQNTADAFDSALRANFAKFFKTLR